MSDALLPPTPVAVRYALLAEPYPGLLPRLLEPFAKRDLTPTRVAAHREGGAMRVELSLEMPPGMVHLVAGNLGQVIGVLDLRVTHETALAVAA
ncbi:hypothetical protein LPC08_17500 [Roseomonas sp. OT10]|uniref:hypothetical protein n=1 Tax=Roseomonas cutis TaxID=2897332 RepID=UPI001E4ADCE4|nr:hypothetical protein [Roseomonas sp. OT10]UFN47795.1 hypothetical protein LPC08_17500 [Roseomonas sp. OT10]